MFELLEEKNIALSNGTRKAIHNYIDFSVRSAVTAFELVQGRIREQFIVTLTHDLRNPLGAADMAADLILDEISDPKQIHYLVGKIRDNLKRADRMIQDLLDASAAREGHRLKLEFSEGDFAKVINEVVKDLTMTHGRRFIFIGEPVSGYFDSNALIRALENMCVNAIKYGDPTAQVTVRLEEIHERVIITVHNYGDPIPMAEQETVFQAFHRAAVARKGNEMGWGLGLPLVRAVAESHGGSIGVTSNAIGGTTFIFDIPKDARPFKNAPIVGS
jgi:signal transduction histidine kinase